jgi:hypothetical protein
MIPKLGASSLPKASIVIAISGCGSRAEQLANHFTHCHFLASPIMLAVAISIPHALIAIWTAELACAAICLENIIFYLSM